MSCGAGGAIGCVYQGNDVTFMARVYRQSDGALLKIAEIFRIQQTIYDQLNEKTPIDQRDLDPITDVFWDTLQNDDRWTVDDIGFNFASRVDSSFLSAELIRVEYVFFLLDNSQSSPPPFLIQLQKMLSA